MWATSRRGRSRLYDHLNDIFGEHNYLSFQRPLHFFSHAFFTPLFRLFMVEYWGMNKPEILGQFGKTWSQSLEMLQQLFRDNILLHTQVFEWHKRFKKGHHEVKNDSRSRSSTSRRCEVIFCWLNDWKSSGHEKGQCL